MKKHAVVVGGGVTGLSTAFQLARRGWRVTLLEKDRLGDGSSRRAAGITTGLLWSETGVRARQVALSLFREFSRTLEGYTFHDEQGCLNLFTPESWPDRARLLPLYDRAGSPYRVLSAADIQREWPALRPAADMIGLHDPHGGYSEPPEYLAALTRAVRRLGVDIREQTPVTGFMREEDAVVGVQTPTGALPAAAVIVTVYVWTLPVLASLHLRLPVKHFVHQRYVTAPQPSPFVLPAINADPLGGYLRPAAGGRLLLGVETADRDEWRVNESAFRLAELADPPGLREEAAARFDALLPGLRALDWESRDVGLISFSLDGEPILGPVAAFPGLFLGLAFHSGGFSYNPVAGQLLAEFVSEGRTSIDVRAFSPDRFPAEATAEHLAETVPQRRAVRRRH